MKGDKLVIHDGHIRAGTQLMEIILPRIKDSQDKFIIAIAGESGSGKSEIAKVVSDLLSENGMKSVILQQDDYFFYPPITNDGMRRENIGHVGMSEVDLELLDKNLLDIIEGKNEIEKPLVIYEEDKVTEEKTALDGIKVAIVEGTYTTSLKNVNLHIFIDRTNKDTREARIERGREEQDEFIERVLEIEHGIISPQREMADVIITRDYEVRTVARG